MSITVIYDGQDLSDFGFAFEKAVDETSYNSYDEYYIPGREGALHIENGSTKNVKREYDLAIIGPNMQNKLDNLTSFLLSRKGYKRLEDSLHPNEYYDAIFKTSISPTIPRDRQKGIAVIEFERKPQRWLKSGEDAIEVEDGDELENPTLFESLPLIRCYGAGTLNIGNQYITISANSYEYIDIDCQLMDARHEMTNCNSYVTFSTDGFITLKAGTNGIEITGFTKVEITPRWFRK